MIDPRFPIGPFKYQGLHSDGERVRLIANIEALPEHLADELRGRSNASLDRPYRAEGWTVRQVVHHVADSHANAYIRFRLALTETNPRIKVYDQQKWAELEDARSFDLEPSLALLRGLHKRWSVLLKSMKPEDFERTLDHPEQGLRTLDFMLALYEWHGRHHLAHVRSVPRN